MQEQILQKKQQERHQKKQLEQANQIIKIDLKNQEGAFLEEKKIELQKLMKKVTEQNQNASKAELKKLLKAASDQLVVAQVT
jgi:hypothetical protein